MELKDFSYHLPEELIAQKPCQQRDHSRMMVLDRAEKSIQDFQFFNLPNFLQEGDTLVINDSKVIPARIFGKKATGANIEILLLTKQNKVSTAEIWEVLLKPAKRIRENDSIRLNDQGEARVLARISDKKWLVQFTVPDSLDEFLKRHGRAPLPPYIKRKNNSLSGEDIERYQTIYAKMPGSIAAPTAGLHFSGAVMQKLQEKGIAVAPITLHVGYGTFLPIVERVVENHTMELEYYEIDATAAAAINKAKRVIAVGTTSARTLESAATANGLISAQNGATRLFIYPGYSFKRVDGLLTNFHLPQSSLFLLVCAFAGTDFIKKAYKQAVADRYSFYSYGDCMLIL